MDVNVINFYNLDNILNIRRFAALRILTIPYQVDCSSLDKYAFANTLNNFEMLAQSQMSISNIEMATLFTKMMKTTRMEKIWLECQNMEYIDLQVAIQSLNILEDVELTNLELTFLQINKFLAP